jgi:hypothetical protein
VTATVAIDSTIRLPNDCRAVQSLRIATGGGYQNIHPLPPERLADTITTAFPVGYVTVGSTLTLIGGSGQPAYALTYYQAIPNLAAAPLDVNWLILREPALYLYATLLEASPYIRDMTITGVWVKQYQDILAGMNSENDSARYGNSPSIPAPFRNAP